MLLNNLTLGTRRLFGTHMRRAKHLVVLLTFISPYTARREVSSNERTGKTMAQRAHLNTRWCGDLAAVTRQVAASRVARADANKQTGKCTAIFSVCVKQGFAHTTCKQELRAISPNIFQGTPKRVPTAIISNARCNPSCLSPLDMHQKCAENRVRRRLLCRLFWANSMYDL